jgi:hypothetical protein
MAGGSPVSGPVIDGVGRADGAAGGGAAAVVEDGVVEAGVSAGV